MKVNDARQVGEVRSGLHPGSVQAMAHPDSYDARSTLEVGGREYEIFRLDALPKSWNVERLPYSLKILLENLLRFEDGETVTKDMIQTVGKWKSTAEPSHEISYTPARVLMQDFTGVPAIVDLAAMRDAMAELDADPAKINPLRPAELVIDHSIQVDEFRFRNSFVRNAELEFERNRERYEFLRWGQTAFDNFVVVPPNTGICHQVNLEYLARVVYEKDGQLFPDTLVGTDSHTTMINGLGVLGWGVGGIEAEAAMLGQAISMLLPQVVGFRLTGKLPEGSTATDLVLTVTEMARERGVVGKFLEFHGEGLAGLPLADRATIGNMSPEMGSTCAIFPVDFETLRYLAFSGRPEKQVELVEAYARTQGLFHDEDSPDAKYSEELELDLGDVVPSIAGPKRPQDRVPLTEADERFREAFEDDAGMPFKGMDEADVESFPASDPPSTSHPDSLPEPDEERSGASIAVAERKKREVAKVKTDDGDEFHIADGYVVIAAITSCTNTSNPSVMIGAGLLAKNARERGLVSRPWVKTSLAPGSKVVTEYLHKAKLMEPLEGLGFNLVGYGCTTCIGNSGPLPEEVSEAVNRYDLSVCSVLSGNRNFEGRIHPEVKMNYLASPPLVVAYALAGRMDLNLIDDPLGVDPATGKHVYLRDIWPTQQDVNRAIEDAVNSGQFSRSYGEIFEGDENWNGLDVPEGDRYAWQDDSTYVKRAPYFDGMEPEPPEEYDQIEGARVLALLGDSVTTDHISPAGAIKDSSPAGRYLTEHGIEKKDFNSYGSRRGNHEVMMRGTFANVRLRNQLAPETTGGVTVHFPDGEQMSIFDAAMKYSEEEVPLCVLAGKEYGSGSSRDWAAKGPRLLGVRFVIAESYERIHRSNLVGMGVLPLQFPNGESVESLGLTGKETFDLAPLKDGAKKLKVSAKAEGGEGKSVDFQATVRIDTPNEWQYYRHGGILHYVLRGLVAADAAEDDESADDDD
jgi:aconitate hydratase A / 2-methylisocitrate dehydratase